MSDQKSPALNRRAVFAGVGAAGALAGVAAVLPAAKAPAVQTAALKPLPDAGGGYQETPHVLQYYQTARV
jgi:cysteine synthase